MIEAAFSDLELLSDKIVGISSDMDELYIQMKYLYEEMSTNPELPSYPQCNAVLENFATGMDRIFRMNEMLLTLKGVMLSADDEYKAQEQKFCELISGCTAALSALQFELSAAFTDMLPVEQNPEVVTQNQVQQLVAQSSSDMQITNIAAVAKMIQEEYCVDTADSSAKVMQSVLDASDDAAISSVSAESIKFDEEELDSVITKDFAQNIVTQENELDEAVAAAEKIKTEVTDPTSIATES